MLKVGDIVKFRNDLWVPDNLANAIGVVIDRLIDSNGVLIRAIWIIDTYADDYWWNESDLELSND